MWNINKKPNRIKFEGDSKINTKSKKSFDSIKKPNMEFNIPKKVTDHQILKKEVIKRDIYTFIQNLAKLDFLSFKSDEYSLMTHKFEYQFFNPLLVSRSLKELFLSLIETKKLFGILNINIYVSDSFQQRFLELCFKYSNVSKNKICVITSLKELSKFSRSNQILLVLDNLTENNYKSLLFHKFYKIHIINTQNLQELEGAYIIPNSVSDLKKLLIFVILILKVLKKDS